MPSSLHTLNSTYHCCCRHPTELVSVVRTWSSPSTHAKRTNLKGKSVIAVTAPSLSRSSSSSIGRLRTTHSYAHDVRKYTTSSSASSASSSHPKEQLGDRLGQSQQQHDMSRDAHLFPFPTHANPTPFEIFHLPVGAAQGTIKSRCECASLPMRHSPAIDPPTNERRLRPRPRAPPRLALLPRARSAASRRPRPVSSHRGGVRRFATWKGVVTRRVSAASAIGCGSGALACQCLWASYGVCARV